MWAVRAILIVVLVLCVVAFAYDNLALQQTVDIHLIWAKRFDVPLLTVVFWAFLVGVLLSLVVFVSMFVKQSVQLRAARRHIRALEGEVTALRNRPIEDSVDLVASGDSGPPVEKPLFTDNE